MLPKGVEVHLVKLIPCLKPMRSAQSQNMTQLYKLGCRFERCLLVGLV